ncbi:putative inactive receptor kinase At1g27190 [Silene latifolia]|uniref:putative inactive receptor kinase At1g27190 n=1 Tax=Silene latifolia TaxID=37657 RepID=UPI003D781F69
MSTLTAISILFLFLLLPLDILSYDDDVRCLQGVKSALTDTNNRLTSWRFSDTSAGSICKLAGVGCWNEKEDRLLSLQLPSYSLAGTLPPALQFCRSLQILVLSDNRLTDLIPPQICEWLPYLVTLDLSDNLLSGPIPTQIGNCKFLNSLVLSGNRLSGQIPVELAGLDRLKKLDLGSNRLSGLVPSGLARFGSGGFGGNDGLCGNVVGVKCGGFGGRNFKVVIIGAVLGVIAAAVLGFLVWYWCCDRTKAKKAEVEDCEKEGSFVGWVSKLGSNKGVQVVLFQKSTNKVRVADLLVATDSFSDSNVVGDTKTGVSYRAVLNDGSKLVIKRLRGGFRLSEKQFRSEITRLGQLRHPNLVPLLGFCCLEDEKLLVYRDMSNGTLKARLHGDEHGLGVLDWRARVKIGVGGARGLAWLHHGCQPPIKHQNISSNVMLLDDDFDVRIADVGLVRLMAMGNSNGSSVANGDFGEFGYVAPEYASTLVASLKGDVYGFGVVLLELVTGQKPLEVNNAGEGFKGSLVHWVTLLSSSGKIKDAIDKSLCGKGDDDEIMKLLKVACSCVASRPKDRPSMFRVYESLKNIAENYGFSEHYDEFPMTLDEQDFEC